VESCWRKPGYIPLFVICVGIGAQCSSCALSHTQYFSHTNLAVMKKSKKNLPSIFCEVDCGDGVLMSYEHPELHEILNWLTDVRFRYPDAKVLILAHKNPHL
jgi:hypothetical protein